MATPTTAAGHEYVRMLSMVFLTFQGTALSLVLRYSRTKCKTPYLPSVAVIFTELTKLVVCMAAQFLLVLVSPLMDPLDNMEGPLQRLCRECRSVMRGSRPLAVPAILFVFQQVLVIIAASHLDAVTFEIFSQSFKIVPTAAFTVWLLGQRLSTPQWLSLPLLVAGVVFMTMHRSRTAAVHDGGWFEGLLACCLSGISSAYAGVYFEKHVKGVHAHGANLWVRNLQLSLYGCPFSIAYALVKDHRAIHAAGIMQGFGPTAWCVVGLQVLGGLVVGFVVKYADNILKNFANAVSVILTALLAVPIFGLWPSGNFLLGVAMVLLAVWLYGANPSLRPERLPSGTFALAVLAGAAGSKFPKLSGHQHDGHEV